MKRGDRKAQVTIFIIIGLILLVSASIVIYLTTIRKAEVIEEIVVPPEVKPIYDYVTNCLYETAAEGITLIGTQGGYADLSPERVDTRDITYTPPAYIKIDPSNTFKLPHWFYEGEDRTPTLEFIQKELADHVDRQLSECLQDFAAFEPQYTVSELGRPQLDSIFTDEDVVIRLKYPLEIRQADKVTEHQDFITHVPVRPKKMWELAVEIMKAENEQTFFENLTIDLISMDREVPMDGMSMSCAPRIWRLQEVEKRVQTLIRANIPRVRVKGTDYPPFLADEKTYELLNDFGMKEINEGTLPNIPTPRDAYEYNRMMIDPGVDDVEDLKVSFVYQPRWGIDLNALPNEGGLLRSNTAPGQELLRFLCINQYHFTYDVIYPVQARISDPAAFNGQGFIFQFGFPVLVDDNEPDREQFGVRTFDDYFVDIGYCETTGGPTAEIRAVGLDSAGYFMASGLRDVNITMLCVNQRCLLGKTGYDSRAPGRYSLITSLPPGCANPVMLAEKDGYLNAMGQLTSEYLEIRMTKLTTIPVEFVKHPYFATRGIQPAVPLGIGDEVSFYLRLRDSPVRHEYYNVYQYGQNETPYIELIDGEGQYKIELMLNNYGTMVGGYKVENITIDYSDFAGAEKIVFHLFEYRPRPVKTDQEKVFNMIMYYMGGEYEEELRPTFE